MVQSRDRKAELIERNRLLLALAKYPRLEDLPERLLDLLMDDNVSEQDFDAALCAMKAERSERDYATACTEVAALACAVIRPKD